jgi:predicted site-specific integrase-resolvase
MAKKLTEMDVPTLWGWLTLPEVAERLGVSRQYVHTQAVSGKFQTLHRIGSIYIVSTDEVENSLTQKVDNPEVVTVESISSDS